MTRQSGRSRGPYELPYSQDALQEKSLCHCEQNVLRTPFEHVLARELRPLRRRIRGYELGKWVLHPAHLVVTRNRVRVRDSGHHLLLRWLHERLCPRLLLLRLGRVLVRIRKDGLLGWARLRHNRRPGGSRVLRASDLLSARRYEVTKPTFGIRNRIELLATPTGRSHHLARLLWQRSWLDGGRLAGSPVVVRHRYVLQR